MVLPSSLRPSAPSASLLRFLKTQSDALCFSAPAPSRYCSSKASNCAAPAPAPRQSWAFDGEKAARLGTRFPSETRLEASSSLFPLLRPLFKKSRPSPDRVHIANGSRKAPGPYTSCSFSSSAKKNGHLRRLLRLDRGPPQPKLKPDDLPVNPTGLEEGYEGNMFNIGRGLAAKASNEPRLRCTELDENGNVTLVNGEFRKSELIAKVWTWCTWLT